MARIGIHSFVWSASSAQADLERTLANTKEAGFELIEFSYLDPANVDIGRLARRIADLDLGVAISIGLPANGDISSADRAVAARGVDILNRTIALTRDLGGRKVGGILSTSHGLQTEAPTRDQWNRSAATLAKVAETAKAAGVTLNLEIVNRFESNLLNTAAQGLAFIEDTGSDNIFLHLDTFHMNIEEADAALAIRNAVGKIGYVHIGESHRGFLGTGSIDFAGIFDALTAIGYDDDLSFESFSSEIVDENLSKKTAIWRNLWTDNMELARHARRFIAVGLETARRKAELVTATQKP
ncbi:sugar phosphate isomerase/epimerase [Mesorhizobium sp. M4B.F.Ca.ET.215.01.1.1]|uniref:sugar phosphate isomerase/epimerase family protein n=1 Tax=unclassified Mesorhizobium TaxID=325217 RepID=UPI000FCBDFB7|nr:MULTISPECIES: sugar phosphate isomerase/epimerase [unclassified Mesorhizobium]RVD45408.1 sugar phosphate isomerase/epimerase [Mesorhizobium sp. M4B.F.Ca.ET.019.03.1.1]TGQ15424.1 sugar phosphate isomerase/epimerase [Mesorhizobium sp. M4B.F.Ca.ET.215.01.1.1]TGQ45532.1 sugar phosphate isomerase/epimerase [Mesorhizobium sp. M4B.F.Ca.ET.214.01.1.1]TGQ48367.1 sugar phosphate isomerase/epimerase [Mesorhizobium sp. M00.F.Ca.ET.220.01.1.1]TGQ63161.1 sugar phosphate isomerase/epimerase [Mesorhizobium